MLARVKKNDTVKVLSGKDKGKEGTVIAILPKKGKVMVKGVSIITKHVKARKAGDVAGIKKQEQYIDCSKVMPVCGSCKKACRIRVKNLDNGKKARVCCHCSESF